MDAEWITDQQASAWLGLPIDVVRSAVASGELPGLNVGGNVRVNRPAVVALGSRAVSATSRAAHSTPTPRTEAKPLDHLPAPFGLEWLEELSPAEEFTHAWPKAKERYPIAWKGVVRLLSEKIVVVVGQSVPREDGHPRITVFFNGYPMAEFAPTLDGTGYASVIKPDGKKTLPMGVPVPPLYQRTHVDGYRRVTGQTGSGRPKGLAVVIASSDARSAVHHAAARWLGKRGGPVEDAAGRDPQLAIMLAAVSVGQAIGYRLGNSLSRKGSAQ